VAASDNHQSLTRPDEKAAAKASGPTSQAGPPTTDVPVVCPVVYRLVTLQENRFPAGKAHDRKVLGRAATPERPPQWGWLLSWIEKFCRKTGGQIISEGENQIRRMISLFLGNPTVSPVSRQLWIRGPSWTRTAV
jgi:hypothetical protein